MTNDELFPLKTEQPETADLKSVLLSYARYWYLFLIAVALCLGAAFIYLRYYTVSVYSVYSTLLIKDEKTGQNLSNADVLNDLSTFKATRNIDNEIQVLRSKSLMTRVVTELGLFTKYSIEGKVRDTEIYGNELPIKVILGKLEPTAGGVNFTVRPKSVDTFELDDYSGHMYSYHFGEQIQKPYGTFSIIAGGANKWLGTKIIVQFQDINQVANYYNSAIGIAPVNTRASVLNLTLTDPIAGKAKDVLNKLMDVYNREAIEEKNLTTANTLKFLDDRLEKLAYGLSGTEKVVEKFKSANQLTDITTQASNYTSQANSYDKQLSEWAIQIDVLESIEGYLEKNAGNYSAVPSTLGIKDETLLALIGKFNELQQERKRMLRTTEPSNPIVQNINEQLASLRISILENLRNIKKGLQITSNSLKASSGQFQSKIKKVPGMERELLEINRQKSIKQNIYSYLLQKREEAALSLAATTAIARVIDPATGGDYPISANSRTIYLMALLLGLAIPFGGIYTNNLLDNKVQSQQDVSAMTPTPILGEISHNNSNESVVVTNGNRSPIAEMFRLIRTNLHFAAVGRKKTVFLITSSMSGEGKTFFSINLGASLAITDKRTLLLDLDLRNPKVAQRLALPAGPGITDYLVSSDILISDIIRESEQVPNLFIISSGPIPPNPAELLLSSKFAQLIEELKENFDYIIMDTPPVGQVADAFTFSAFADISIYLVRYNMTIKSQLKIIRNIYKSKSLIAPMIVLNDAKQSNGNNYGFGYGYGYPVKEKMKKKATG